MGISSKRLLLPSDRSPPDVLSLCYAFSGRSVSFAWRFQIMAPLTTPHRQVFQKNGFLTVDMYSALAVNSAVFLPCHSPGPIRMPVIKERFCSNTFRFCRKISILDHHGCWFIVSNANCKTFLSPLFLFPLACSTGGTNVFVPALRGGERSVQ